MNTISTTGNITLNLGGLRTQGTLTNSYTMSGSNGIANSMNVTSSYSLIDTNGLSDIRYGYFLNGNDETENSGSITIASDLAGTKVISILQPGDVCLISYSGSLSLYTKTSNATTASVLQYIAAEA